MFGADIDVVQGGGTGTAIGLRVSASGSVNNSSIWIPAGNQGINVGYASNIATTPINGAIFAGNIGIGTASPNASAILDARSTTKGVRMPNMTTAQKNAIASPRRWFDGL
jgi:hypothetical protein